MEIIIKPRRFEGCSYWEPKMEGVVLVEKQEDIEPLWKLLCEQDDYWESYKEVIQVAPKEISSESDLIKMCVYVGKTDIYEPEKIREKIPFIMYQTRNCNDLF